MVEAHAPLVTGTAPAEAAAKLLQAQAAARKAVADATTAEVAAEAALAKGALGVSTAGPFKGTVTLGDKAAVAETNILARHALSEVADQIAGKLVEGGRKCFLLTSGTAPAFAELRAYEFRRALVARMLQDSLAASVKLLPDGVSAGTDREGSERPSRIAGLATVGLALSGVDALLGYVRTNTTVGGSLIDLGQRPLLVAVAAKLLQSGKRVWIDGSPVPVNAKNAKPLQDELANVEMATAAARTIADRHAMHMASIAPSVQISEQPGGSDLHAPERALHQKAKDALIGAIGAADRLLQSLLTEDDGVLLENILQQAATEAFLEDGHWVSLTLDTAVSSSLIKEHLFAGWLGGTPLKISATVTASWSCYRGRDLELEAAGSQYVYTGLQSIDRIFGTGTAAKSASRNLTSGGIKAKATSEVLGSPSIGAI